MVVNLDITKALQNIGCNENQISVFIFLLNNGESSIAQITKGTNIPRTTVYRTCKELTDQKLIETVISNYSDKYKTAPSITLQFQIEKKKQELETFSESMQLISENIKSLEKGLPKTAVRYFKGIDGMKQLIWNTTRAQKGIIGYSVFGRKDIVGKEFIKKYNMEILNLDIKDRIIITNETVPKATATLSTSFQRKYQNIRIIQTPNFYISGDTYIYNNVYAVNFWNENEVIGIEIENTEIAKVQKSIFETMWRISKNF
ncbi:MAG TPA: helix-turn-helix domain-containing protein [Candidatus Dojkabacteria bacterium]|nr:helix-turn-helix domain-containing protein [Candidatus Dojkabacteria bacterium]